MAAGIAVQAQTQALPEIIDTHIHIYDPARGEGVPWPPQTEPVLYKPHLAEDFRNATQGLGVSRAVIVEASSWLEDNQWILDRCEEDSIFAGVVGNLPVGKPAFAASLDRFRRNPRFKGIRLNSTALPDAVNDLKLLAQTGLALDVIGGPELVARVADVAAKIPTLRIVIDHLPLYPSVPLDSLKGAQNVYAKVSGVLRRMPDGKVPASVEAYRPALDELWSTFGSERLIYASNWPVSNRLAPYATVLKVVRAYVSARGGTAQRAFFAGNARRLYRLG